jgi:hypothetical protein
VLNSAFVGPISGDASTNGSTEAASQNTVIALALGETSERDESESQSVESESDNGLDYRNLLASGDPSSVPLMLGEVEVVEVPDEEGEYSARGHNGNGYDGKSAISKFIDLRLELLSQANGDFIEEIDTVRFLSFESYAALADELYQLGRDLDENMADEKRLRLHSTEVSVGISVSLSAGVVSWVLRGGSLLASFMSVAPLWAQIDPLPILSAGDNRKEEDKTGEPDQTEEEDTNAANLEKFFDKGL